MENEKEMVIDLMDYVDGKTTVETARERAAKEPDSKIVLGNAFLLKSNDKKILHKIFELIYALSVEDREVYVPVMSKKDGKDVFELRLYWPWYRVKPNDVIAEIEADDLYREKISAEDAVRLCKKKNANVLQINNSKEDNGEKETLIKYVLIKELTKHGIEFYDPLSENRDKKKNPQGPRIQKENLTDYKSDRTDRPEN